MEPKTQQTFVRDALPIQWNASSFDSQTIGAALFNDDGSATAIFNRPFFVPESVSLLRTDRAVELRTSTPTTVSQRDDAETIREFLHVIAPVDRDQSLRSGVEILSEQIRNRIRLLREALLAARDWKVRLVLQYELDIVLRHAAILEGMIHQNAVVRRFAISAA